MEPKLTKMQIIEALAQLDRECAAQGIMGEICIYGGAEMVLAFDARESTRDVDAVFKPKTELLKAAQKVASQLGLPENWLNDGVKGFLSPNEEVSSEQVSRDIGDLSNLRVYGPTAEYLLAMKCVAARSDHDSQDKADVTFLVDHLGISSEDEVFDIVGRFYPLEKLHVKCRYFVSEIIDEGKSSPDMEV